jgi:hypothetical protein
VGEREGTCTMFPVVCTLACEPHGALLGESLKATSRPLVCAESLTLSIACVGRGSLPEH